MSTTRIYLDYAASSPLWPDVISLMTDTMRSTGNPSSIHQEGRFARHSMNKSRFTLQTLLDCKKADIIFTSGGTEANHAAIHGLAQYSSHFFISSIEHDSIIKACPHAIRLPVLKKRPTRFKFFRTIFIKFRKT